jgi:DNA-binding beta-propeller fold protein YncE
MRRVAGLVAVGAVAAIAAAAGCSRAPAVSSVSKPGASRGGRARISDPPSRSPSALPQPQLGINSALTPPGESGAGELAPGSDPTALPGPVLIADKLNNRLLVVDPEGRVRWQFPRPGDLPPGMTFRIPDDAFFTSDGRQIIATQEDDFVISVVDVATHRIVWRYGVPGIAGSAPNLLWNPDDAILLPDSTVVAADIKNCRLIKIPYGQHAVSWQAGRPGHCRHDPPATYGSPNGMFPASGGGFVVTEINGDWVDGIDANGNVQWTTHAPGVTYPSDTNEIAPNQYLTVDYSTPGQIETFTNSGQLLWRYEPGGADRMSHPSLALPLPNGDVLATDDYNHRVIVVDPRTNRIRWQYGHTGVAGTAPGYLDNPDGADLLPPYAHIDATR